MEQRARNVTEPVDGCVRRARYLIHDRDSLSTRGFGEIMEGGVSSRSVSRRRVPISPRMPSGSSALFKRSVSVASSPSAKGPLRLLVGEYVDHDQRERNHQGLDNQLLPRPPPPVSLAADVQRRERLGGWLNFYHREAA